MKFWMQTLCGIAAGSWLSCAITGEPSRFTYVVTFAAFVAVSLFIGFSKHEPI